MIEQSKLFADDMHKDIHLFIEHDESLDGWITEHHYLHSAPAISIIRMCFKDRNQRILGGMLWNKPTARKLGQDNILELTRMCFIDDTPHFIESQCLGMARKHIRTHHNDVKGLIAYSSTGAGHEGTIYKADNWYQLGTTKGASWETREGRVNRDLSLKIRWTRSP